MMKKCCALLLIVLLPTIVWADPRMETRGNFCHFIHNIDNSDDESFIADCGSQISVNDTRGVAHGFAYVERKRVPVFLDEIAMQLEQGDKAAVVITSQDFKGLACTLVDSNGVVYESDSWVNQIFYQAKGKRFGKVVYQLHCFNAKPK